MPPTCRLMQGSAAPLHIDTGLHCSGAYVSGTSSVWPYVSTAGLLH